MLERFHRKRPLSKEKRSHLTTSLLIPIVLATSHFAVQAPSLYLSTKFKVRSDTLFPVAQALIDYAYAQKPVPGNIPIVALFSDKDCQDNKPRLNNTYYYNRNGTMKRLQAYPIIYPESTNTQDDDINVICINPGIASMNDDPVSKANSLNTIQSLAFKMFHEYYHVTKKDNFGNIPDGAREEAEANTAALKLLRKTNLSTIPYSPSIPKKTVLEIYLASLAKKEEPPSQQETPVTIYQSDNTPSTQEQPTIQDSIPDMYEEPVELYQSEVA